jgi:uncharacterized membrane protein
MRRLRELLWALRSSLWLIPGVALVLAMAAGIALVGVDPELERGLAQRWPRLFGVGPDGARGTLEAIAGSMITVAGVVFSVTLVALSLAASTYSPRILRTFMHDRGTQLAFGVFVGAFAYCLVVLRTVRAGGDGGEDFVPSLAVLGALVLALVAVCVLVYFIHHVVVSIQVSTILARVARETSRAIDGLFPEQLGAGEDDEEPAQPAGLAWRALPARRSGYIVAVDGEGLLDWAARRGATVRMELAVGEFAVQSLPIASVAGGRPGDAEADARALDACYSIAEQRTIEQDAGFGVQQIVDVAVRALSPGVNDPTTARMCIHHLAALLVRLARRRPPSRLRYQDGELRVIAKAPGFEALAALVFETLARYADGKPEVLATLSEAARLVASVASPSRRAAVERHLAALGGLARSAKSPA